MPPPVWLKPLYQPVVVSFGGFVTLTNIGAAYDAINASKGLGIARIDFTNVAAFEFGVFVNKIGTGTQSWQLWSVTDSQELAVINDSAGAGDKVLSVTVNNGGLIPTGIKTVRVRAKSTTAADDPLYYSGFLILT